MLKDQEAGGGATAAGFVVGFIVLALEEDVGGRRP